MSVRVGRYLIYGLIDPRNRTLRYIGKTHKRKEWRLTEHINLALENDKRAIYVWIRELLSKELQPEIFVWERIPPDEDWRKAEKNEIAFWKADNPVEFPYYHPPQTKKSKKTLIEHVVLLNATEGG